MIEMHNIYPLTNLQEKHIWFRNLLSKNADKNSSGSEKLLLIHVIRNSQLYENILY